MTVIYLIVFAIMVTIAYWVGMTCGYGAGMQKIFTHYQDVIPDDEYSIRVGGKWVYVQLTTTKQKKS